jgi:endoglucanase
MLKRSLGASLFVVGSSFVFFAVAGGACTPENAGGGGTGGAITGGTPGSGGASTGGVAANGGTNPATGGRATGGANPSTGGTPTGGTTTGGTTSSTGGKATGGQATGGAATGGGSTTGLPALHVEGNAIKDPNGKTIVLRGVSLIDIGALYYNAGQNVSGITARIDKITTAGLVPHVLRFPVYPRTCFNTGGAAYYSSVPFPVGQSAPSGTHIALTQDQYLSNVLKPAVDYATQKNMYVIIDYHQIDNTSGTSATDATTFWTYMAAKFASYTNVLYEPFNEPIDSTTSWATFKPRVQTWVDAIRASAPNNIIIVPSMSWCQRPGDATSSPPTGSNFVYTAHVYPGNWSTTFKQQVSTAAARAPVFFTEWGYILNGSDTNLGTTDTTWGTTFEALVDGNGGSWTAWVADNGWTPNMFSSSSLTTLTDFGTVVKNWLSAKATSDWVQ